MSNKTKTFCYEKKGCGPVVLTGFNIDQYYVCKQCKQEVSSRLAEQIKERDAIQSEGREVIPDGGKDEVESMFDVYGFGGYVPSKPKDPDPDDYI